MAKIKHACLTQRFEGYGIGWKTSFDCQILGSLKSYFYLLFSKASVVPTRTLELASIFILFHRGHLMNSQTIYLLLHLAFLREYLFVRSLYIGCKLVEFLSKTFF